MLRHLFSDPYVCTIVITNAIYSIKKKKKKLFTQKKIKKILFTQNKRKKKKDKRLFVSCYQSFVHLIFKCNWDNIYYFPSLDGNNSLCLINIDIFSRIVVHRRY